MHGEFLRALFLQDHRETEQYSATGMLSQQTTDSFRFSFAARHPHEEIVGLAFFFHSSRWTSMSTALWRDRSSSAHFFARSTSPYRPPSSHTICPSQQPLFHQRLFNQHPCQLQAYKPHQHPHKPLQRIISSSLESAVKCRTRANC